MARSPDRYEAEILAWRAEREGSLRMPDGWLSLVGLHWLEPGENSIAGLPGTFVVDRQEVRHRAPDGAQVVLRDDLDGRPTVVDAGTRSFHLIRRGERLGIRVRDSQAPTLRQFRGLDYFDIDPRWRLVARLDEAEGRTIEVPNVLGDSERQPSPGSLSITVGGVACRLDALEGENGGLWLLFGDATNGVETYPGGRFLKTGPPLSDGTVVVDFNRAYNPPCVFTPYATCPLPPPQNRLSVRIDAGERGYAAAHR